MNTESGKKIFGPSIKEVKFFEISMSFANTNFLGLFNLVESFQRILLVSS